MDRPLRLVAVSGGLQRPSKSAALAEHMLRLISDEIPSDHIHVELSQLAPWLGSANWRPQLHENVEQALRSVEQADALVVVSPVFRGAYTGLFKHFFDFIDQYALIDKPVLLAATGGSARHSLVIEHHLRPLFSFFQTQTLPLGVYATDAEFADYQLSGRSVTDRARLAVKRALPFLQPAHPRASQVSEGSVAARMPSLSITD